MRLSDSVLKDLILINLLLAVAFFLFSRFDILEAIVDFSHRYEPFEIDEILSTLVVFALCMPIFTWRRLREAGQARQELARQNNRLEAALAEVKTLHEIIPICSYCHKIRNEEGAWSALYDYISGQLNPTFSHGICPACLGTHMREIDKGEEWLSSE